MVARKVLLLVSIISFQFTSGYGAEPYFKKIGTANGLSHRKVNAVIRDSRGFMWFGTEDGLNRYDGKHITVYKSEPGNGASLSGNIITDLLEDHDGMIWIATADGGLTRYDYRLSPSLQFKQYKHRPNDKNSIPENSVTKLAEDRFGNLWMVSGDHYTLRFDKRTERFTIPAGKGEATILALTVVGDTLWADRSGGGVLRIDTRNLTWVEGPQAMRPDGKSGVLPRDQIKAFAQDSKGNLWIAGKGYGVTFYDVRKNSFTSYRSNPNKEGSVADDHINDVYIDREDIVWIATDNGISVFNPLFSPFIRHTLSVSKDFTIYDFHKDRSGKLLIGTSNGIYVKVPGLKEPQLRRLVYNGRRLAATTFYRDADGVLYVGTDYGLFIYEENTNRIRLLPNTEKDTVMSQFTGSRVVSIIRDTVNGHPALLVSLPDHYITYYDLWEKQWISGKDRYVDILSRYGIKDNLIHKFYKDRKGNLWLANNKYGLGNWAPDSGKPIHYFINDPGDKSSLTSNYVFDMAEDPEGQLWVATYGGGVNRFDPARQVFSHLKESSNLTEGMQFDRNNNLWMLCNGHIHRYAPGTGIYSCYDLPSVQTTGGVKGYIFKDDQDNLYAAGQNYYVIFNPDIAGKIKAELDVWLTDFRIFNNSFSHLLEKPRIELKHTQNYFSFEFAAPEFSGDNVNYAYKLEGFDEEWIEAGKKNVAHYANLPGGTYVFKVRASNWTGGKFTKYRSVQVVIIPPFWRRWWFNLTVFISIIVTVYLISRYRINMLLRQHGIRTGIAQDLHDQVGATLSSISVYSDVARLYHKEGADAKLSEVLSTINRTSVDMISEMGDIVWAINPKNDHFDSIFRRISHYAQPLCKAKGINFRFYCDDRLKQNSLGMKQRKNLFLIIKEAVNNAIKHSACQQIAVDLRFTDKMITLQIRDDGRGFPAGDLQHKQPLTPGNGLYNLQSRANELQGNLQIISEPGEGCLIFLSFNPE